MRTIHAVAIAISLSSYSAVAQSTTIDLNLWTEEQINGSAPWMPDPARLFTHSTNTLNTDCSVFYSDFQATFLEFSMSVDPTGGDDDIIGFVLGWNPGDSSNASADYLLVDWKRVTQSYQDWGTAAEGLAVSHVVGPFTRGYGGGPIDLWSHTGACTELARGTTYGQQGWAFAREYDFRVLYIPGGSGSIDVWIDGQLELHATGAFNTGRFGCYNFSQDMTEFQFALQGSVTSFGSGCQGTAGTPLLFAPEEPLVGRFFPVLVANLPPSGTALLLVGASNSSLGGVPLPLDLAAVGAAGCSIYTSSEAAVPVTSYGGTAYINLAIPNTAFPSAAPSLYMQGLALDPGANALGVVLSNAASVQIGIR